MAPAEGPVGSAEAVLGACVTDPWSSLAVPAFFALLQVSTPRVLLMNTLFAKLPHSASPGPQPAAAGSLFNLLRFLTPSPNQGR